MKFLETHLKGAFIIELEPHLDARGFFARTFCTEEFAAHDLETQFVQCNLSSNRKKGTLRGLHFQWAPWGEAKLVRCVRGAIWDVIVDLRPESPTFGGFEAVELSSDNRRSFYVPQNFAHGFQTLTDNAEVFYQMSNRYAPDAAAGINAKDPELGIKWPLSSTLMSEKDRRLPALSELKGGLLRKSAHGASERTPVGGRSQ